MSSACLLALIVSCQRVLTRWPHRAAEHRHATGAPRRGEVVDHPASGGEALIALATKTDDAGSVKRGGRPAFPTRDRTLPS